MVMSWIWTGICGLSILCAALLGKGQDLAVSVLQGAQAGVTLAVSRERYFPVRRRRKCH